MSANYVKRVGKQIYNHQDQPFTLRGVGIGGWLLLEGYMVKSFDNIDRPRRFVEHFEHTVGKEYTKYFFQQWYQQFFTERDIQLIKEHGFNSIRIPIDYSFLYIPSETKITLTSIPSQYAILDNIIRICSEKEIYVILDMHAAPGGQTGTNIDNSMNNHPDLFENKLYQDQLCFIWADIATRYKDEPYIAAYDLLNEPLPNWQAKYNDKLIPLYRRVIKSIRQVDENHMITLEGLHWSTDWTCFTDLLDDNLLLQFHKYWNNPDIESIQEYIDIREKLQVPIFMGEGGENNLEWYYAVFKMYDQLDISFNFWTYKKMANTNSIISFDMPSNWKAFLSKELDQEMSQKVLEELLQHIRFNASTINQSCINHILRQDNLVIPAFGYDYDLEGKSYHSTQIRNAQLRKNDHFHFVDRNHKMIQPDFKQYNGESYTDKNRICLALEAGEWVQYSFYSRCANPRISIISNQNQFVISTLLYDDKDGKYTLTLKAVNSVLIEKIIISS
jgi:hypothetical protein